jgi:hypothetical protein
MNSVKLLQDLLKRVHKCIVREEADGLLRVDIVHIDVVDVTLHL